MPVFVDNDANLALLAEARAGAARDRRHALMLTLGTGIGGGILVDGTGAPSRSADTPGVVWTQMASAIRSASRCGSPAAAAHWSARSAPPRVKSRSGTGGVIPKSCTSAAQ